MGGFPFGCASGGVWFGGVGAAVGCGLVGWSGAGWVGLGWVGLGWAGLGSRGRDQHIHIEISVLGMDHQPPTTHHHVRHKFLQFGFRCRV